jgi:hypothetical protein
VAFTNHVRNISPAGSSLCRFRLRRIGFPADLSWAEWAQSTARRSMQMREAAHHVHDLESRRNRAVFETMKLCSEELIGVSREAESRPFYRRKRTFVDLAGSEKRLRVQGLSPVHHRVPFSHPLQVVDQLIDGWVGNLDLVDVDGRECETGAIQQRRDGLRVCVRQET